MTTIPPNWLGSIIQTQGAQERAGQAKSEEEAKGTQRGEFSERLRDVIENSDRDVEVYSDAEGAGGQGGNFSEAEEDEQAEVRDAEADRLSNGLDLEA